MCSDFIIMFVCPAYVQSSKLRIFALLSGCPHQPSVVIVPESFTRAISVHVNYGSMAPTSKNMNFHGIELGYLLCYLQVLIMRNEVMMDVGRMGRCIMSRWTGMNRSTKDCLHPWSYSQLWWNSFTFDDSWNSEVSMPLNGSLDGYVF